MFHAFSNLSRQISKSIPWSVAGRVGLLFVILCLIKMAILAGLQKHLFQIHWRTNVVMPHGWLNPVLFLFFAALVAMHIWRLGNRCGMQAIQIRSANVCVLVLGMAFILLSSSVGNKNIVFSLADGLSNGRDLFGAFFSQPPLWAVWLLLYVLFYHVLVCVGREHLVLRLTAVMAALYTILFLQDMMSCRDALLVVDCLGVACWLGGRKPDSQLGWFWQLQPWLWLMFFFSLFISQHDHLRQIQPERALPAGCGLVLLTGLSMLALRWKFYAAWSWLLPFAFAAFCLLINISYDFVRNDLNLLCEGMTLPHYFLGEFALASTLLVLGVVYLRWLPSGSLWWLDVCNLLLIMLALADLSLSHIMGIRLDWQALEFGANATMVWRMAKPYLPDATIGIILIFGIYFVLTGLLRWSGTAKKQVNIGPGAQFLFISFILLGISGAWFSRRDLGEGESVLLLAKTSPWIKRADLSLMDGKTFLETSRQLGLQSMLLPPPAGTHPPRNMNVVLIFQESSHNKYLSLFGGKENTQPLLAGYKDRMEVFPNFFSSFAGSINARFATLSGLYPARNYEAFTLHRVEVKSIFDVLHEQGYATSVFDSASLDYTGFREFLRGRGIDVMLDADTLPERNSETTVSWGVREGVTLKAIRSQIRQYAGDRQKFFLSYFPVAPHYPFDGIPQEFRKFRIKKEDGYVAQYENELLYMDWVISSILDELKKSGLLENTLVVITDDHGEMLGEKGGEIGHGWVVTPELANIPLIIMDPDNPGFHRNETTGSQVDLLPTILDLLGITTPAGQLYQGVSLYAPAAQVERKIYLNSFQDYATLEGGHFMRNSRANENLAAANNPSFRVFSMTNSDSRTVFTETDSGKYLPPHISGFDQFQENFLENYERYREAVQAAPAGRN